MSTEIILFDERIGLQCELLGVKAIAALNKSTIFFQANTYIS